MEKTKSKNIQKIVTVLILMIVFIIIIFAFFRGSKKTTFLLKKEYFTVELGDEYSLHPRDYIKGDKEVLDDTKISVKNANDVPCNCGPDIGTIAQEYPVGEYEGTATYKDKKLKFMIEIKDTKAPAFENFKEAIEVELGDTKDLTTNFKVNDASEVTITVDTTGVDFNKVGSYPATVKAVDKYNNSTQKEITIVIQ